MSSTQTIQSLQQAVWAGSLPLEIRLSPADSRIYDKTDPFYIHVPRLSYLPFLQERIYKFFKPDLIDPSLLPSSAWFSFESIPLKWHHPIGLLYDLFSNSPPAVAPSSFHPHQSTSKPSTAAGGSSLPWRLVVHYSSFPSDQLVPLDAAGKTLHDAFINSVKEADFLRNGTANAIMKLNIEDSTMLWEAVVGHDLTQFSTIYTRLLPPTGTLRHIPLRIYLPSSTPAPSSSPSLSPQSQSHLRVIQSLLPPFTRGTREPQTLGTALNSLIPALFPSRRRTILARPVLHGAIVPLEAVLDDLMRGACYADGWVNLGIEIVGT